jgi:hypothetical protein
MEIRGATKRATFSAIGQTTDTSPDPPLLTSLLCMTPKASKIFEATIEITLTKRRMPNLYGIDNAPWHVNEDVLLDSAFDTKQYKIVVENGQFYPKGGPQGGPIAQLFALRVIFDKSPYPPKEEWRPEQMNMVESVRQFEMTEFYARELDDQESRAGCILM